MVKKLLTLTEFNAKFQSFEPNFKILICYGTCVSNLGEVLLIYLLIIYTPRVGTLQNPNNIALVKLSRKLVVLYLEASFLVFSIDDRLR